jgi:hypothetical protein
MLPMDIRLRPGNVHSADGWDGVLKPERFEVVDEVQPILDAPRYQSCFMNLQASNTSARRPIGQGFALYCLAERPNEIQVATRTENSSGILSIDFVPQSRSEKFVNSDKAF